MCSVDAYFQDFNADQIKMTKYTLYFYRKTGVIYIESFKRGANWPITSKATRLTYIAKRPY